MTDTNFLLTVLCGLVPGSVLVVIAFTVLGLSWLRKDRTVDELQGALQSWIGRCLAAENELYGEGGTEVEVDEDEGEGEEWKRAGG